MAVQGAVKRLAPPALLAVLLAAGCSGGNSQSALLPSPTPVATPAASPTVPTRTIEVWLTMSGHLFQVNREIPSTQAVGAAAIQQLLAGPTPGEAAAGVGSEIAAGSTLESLEIKNGTATATFSSPLETDPLSDGQVVYTLTQFPTVKRVLVNTAEGGPLTRHDLANQLPAILVETPRIGDQISNPVTIAGTADVFEATVSIRILDRDGHALVNGFATATCGTGCRGTFSQTFSYSVSENQPGTVMVFEASAENGRPINVVRIPVTLTS